VTAKPPLKNVAASVRDRLTRQAGERKENVQLALTRCATERLLYRLSVSANSGQFVLKTAKSTPSIPKPRSPMSSAASPTIKSVVSRNSCRGYAAAAAQSGPVTARHSTFANEPMAERAVEISQEIAARGPQHTVDSIVETCWVAGDAREGRGPRLAASGS
jgi:hypothetical protein